MILNFSYLKFDFKKILQVLMTLFIFLIPFQIKDIIYQAQFISGKFSPYLTFELNFQDILFGFIVLIFGYLLLKKEINLEINHMDIFLNSLLLILLLIVIQTLFMGTDLLSFLKIFRILECFILFIILQNAIFDKDEIKIVFMIAMALQVLIALLQYITQGSIGLHFLGESFLSSDSLGIAKVDILNKKFIRGYGTFLHPNIFSAFCAVALFFAMSFWKRRKILVSMAIFWFLVGIFVGMSRSVILGMGVILICAFLSREWREWRQWRQYELSRSGKRKYILGILLGIFLILFLAGKNFDILKERFSFSDSATISERILQIDISLEMIKKYPFGVGLGNFVNHMQEFSDEVLAPWQFQPVHNFWLMLATELGVLITFFILLLGFYLFWQFWKMRNLFSFVLLLFIFIVSQFDHYFYDIYAGQMLIVIVFGIIASMKYETISF